MSVARIFAILQKIEAEEAFTDQLRDQISGELVQYKNKNPDNINDLYAVLDFFEKICQNTKSIIEQDVIFRVDKTRDVLTSFAQEIVIDNVKKWDLESDATYFLELQGKKNQDIKLDRVEKTLIRDAEAELSAGKAPKLTYTVERKLRIVPLAK